MPRLHRGSTLAEVLVVLLVVSVLIPVTVLCLKSFPPLLTFDEELQDQIALSQLRRILLLSYDLKYTYDELSFTYQEKERHLMYRNDHLVMTPGTQIFLSAVDDAYFQFSDNAIYVCYQRGSKEYEKVLSERP